MVKIRESDRPVRIRRLINRDYQWSRSEKMRGQSEQTEKVTGQSEQTGLINRLSVVKIRESDRPVRIDRLLH